MIAFTINIPAFSNSVSMIICFVIIILSAANNITIITITNIITITIINNIPSSNPVPAAASTRNTAQKVEMPYEFRRGLRRTHHWQRLRAVQPKGSRRR